MKYRTQYDLFDPEVLPDGSEIDAKADPNAPDDAYTIGEHGNTVKAPDADARSSVQNASKPWVKPLAIVLTVLCIALTGLNVARVLNGPRPLPKPTPARIRQTLFLGVMRIDAYRQVHGVTPETLADAGLPVNSGYTYHRVDGWHYILGFENRGPRLEYNSKDPKESFFGSPQAVLSMGESE